jgi:hypothetical protein
VPVRVLVELLVLALTLLEQRVSFEGLALLEQPDLFGPTKPLCTQCTLLAHPLYFFFSLE